MYINKSFYHGGEKTFNYYCHCLQRELTSKPLSLKRKLLHEEFSWWDLHITNGASTQRWLFTFGFSSVWREYRYASLTAYLFSVFIYSLQCLRRYFLFIFSCFTYAILFLSFTVSHQWYHGFIGFILSATACTLPSNSQCPGIEDKNVMNFFIMWL